MDNYLVLLIVIVVGFGLYYYFEVISKKIGPTKENKSIKVPKKSTKKECKLPVETNSKSTISHKKKKESDDELSINSSFDLSSVSSEETAESSVASLGSVGSLNSQISLNESNASSDSAGSSIDV